MRFKEHIQSEMVSELTATAIKFASAQQLRERINSVVQKYTKKNTEWYNTHDTHDIHKTQEK